MIGATLLLAAIIIGISSINDRPAAAIAATKPDLESLPQRINALIKGYEKESRSNREAHDKTTKELGSIIINLMILLKTNEVEMERVAFKTNWQLNIFDNATNANRRVVRYTE